MNIEPALEAAERKAWEALARYKFWMFGYWASQWVALNHIGGFHRPSPFRGLVRLARLERERPRRRLAEADGGMKEVKDVGNGNQA